jgi:ABC-type branched-subunit amino acid transport system substrate-binding protein
MTLAQNRQPRLSGNKILSFLLLIIIVSAFACKSRRGGEYYEEDPKNAGTNTSLETIVWSDKPGDYPPIKDNDVPDPVIPITPPVKPVDPVITEPDPVVDPTEPDPVETHYSFNVAFLAPFYANKAGGGSITSKSSIKSLEFYTGAKMALDILGSEGINMKVYSYDTQGSASKISSIMSQSEFSSMDMLIGPMKTDALKTAAARVKGSSTVLISPWNPKSTITSRNPNYVQVSPSLETHCKAIMRHVRKNHDINDVVLACKEGSSESSYFRYFQDENKVISGNASAPSIPQLEAEYGNNIPLVNYFRPDSTIFIIPSWDEKFVSNFLRKLAIDKGRRKIVVYGLPQWMDFERIDFDYYERLNIHISSAVFIDAEDEQVRNFRRNYYNRTGTIPGNDAFLGYDLTLYFGRMLKNKGRNFLTQIDMNPSRNGQYIHTQFKFEADYPYGTDNFSSINKFENKFVNILKFEGFKFQKAN